MKPLLILSAAAALPVVAAPLAITAVNKLPLARASQTIELTAAQLAPLGAKDLTAVHVKDATGKELVVQAVDTDGDAYRKPDIVIFQADFAPNETKTFTATIGEKQLYTKDQYKAFGRFNRERFDDFAWENDRIAHRTYGKALGNLGGRTTLQQHHRRLVQAHAENGPQRLVHDRRLSRRPRRRCGFLLRRCQSRLWWQRLVDR